MLLRAAMAAALSISLAGCLGSNTPAISTKSAEDVGQRLQYSEFQGVDTFRLEKRSGVDYQFQALTGNPDEPVHPFANGIYVRKLGFRADAPVYLVQFDLARFEINPRISPQSEGFSYFIYPVAIDGEGHGIVGIFACDRQDILDRARRVGLKIDCVDKGGVPIPFVSNRADESALWTFLSGLLADGLFEWEDETGKNASSRLFR